MRKYIKSYNSVVSHFNISKIQFLHLKNYSSIFVDDEFKEISFSNSIPNKGYREVELILACYRKNVFYNKDTFSLPAFLFIREF